MKKTIKLIPVTIFIALFLIGGRSMLLEAAEDKYIIQWEIDRSAVPKLPFNDITLNVAVGQANAISAVDENDEELPVLYNEKTGVASITTDGDFIELTFFTETAGNPLLGSYVPATLKNDLQWAWSHGIDDNINLEGSISQFQKRDWAGTLFLIGELIEQPNLVPDSITTTRVQELMAEGWSIGNHTFDHYDCEARPGTYEQNVLDGQAILNEIVAGSEIPDYPILSLAAPCFLNGFHPALLNLRDSSAVSLRVNESGFNVPVILDSGALNEIIENQQVNAFNIDSPLGRDGTIDAGTLDETIRRIDWVARHSNDNRHLWYNSLSHGEFEDRENADVESRLGGLVEYIYRKYGPLGTNEVWVAPSDHIISYVTVRDLAEFKVVSVSRNSEGLARDTIRTVEPNSAGNLESAGFLPTRIRPEDTPIPIILDIAEASTPVPTPQPTIEPTAFVTPTNELTTTQSTEISTLPDDTQDTMAENGIEDITLPNDLERSDNVANIAVWSVMIVAALISIILAVILGVFGLRYWRTRNNRT